ncbi:Kv channel-interacting protein 1-like [Pogonomyrmex barbatus]|uniref:Kv channel-interacting protein 1-like n=1 Tax=Pogonomyrmex barbatus TaxID=144034 RepID=A0A6I9XBM1_9HYME|nr:Kv channel-interacting protein 1-like [Pogonomyrmex barbatus]
MQNCFSLLVEIAEFYFNFREIRKVDDFDARTRFDWTGEKKTHRHLVLRIKVARDFRQSRGLQDLLVTLSTLLRGSIYEKLRWTFKLYDINGDGCITRGELGEVVTAVHELMGRRHHAEEERKAREQLDRVFKKLDLNQDGVITIEEFIESCLKDDVITRSLAMFDCAL